MGGVEGRSCAFYHIIEYRTIREMKLPRFFCNCYFTLRAYYLGMVTFICSDINSSWIRYVKAQDDH